MSKINTTYIDQPKPKQEEQKGQEQGKQHQKQKGGGGGGSGGMSNYLVIRLVRTAYNFYRKIVEEVILALILVTPAWLYFYINGIKEVTINTDLPTLLVIATGAFILQSLMFRK